jgi:hypothetical protein
MCSGFAAESGCCPPFRRAEQMRDPVRPEGSARSCTRVHAQRSKSRAASALEARISELFIGNCAAASGFVHIEAHGERDLQHFVAGGFSCVPLKI